MEFAFETSLTPKPLLNFNVVKDFYKLKVAELNYPIQELIIDELLLKAAFGNTTLGNSLKG